jgi:hypothetical protein
MEVRRTGSKPTKSLSQDIPELTSVGVPIDKNKTCYLIESNKTTIVMFQNYSTITNLWFKN